MDPENHLLDAADNPRKLVLASRSPRRRQLLAEAGFAYTLSGQSVDDGGLLSGPVDPEQWVMALAYLKAVGGAEAGLADTAGSDQRDQVVGAPQQSGDGLLVGGTGLVGGLRIDPVLAPGAPRQSPTLTPQGLQQGRVIA